MGERGAGNQWGMVLILIVTGRDGINAQVEGRTTSRAEGYCFPCDGWMRKKIQIVITGTGS